LVEPQNQGLRFISGLASKPLGWFVSGLASKPLRQFVSGLTSKPLGRFSPVWPQNRLRRFLRFGLKTSGEGFSSLASKPVVSLLVEPQNQGDEGFMVWASKSEATVW
jgi:hypothetical protein